ncbi:MAG: phosphatase PAP2 family protein [Gemmataceae bacterium]
MPNNISRSFLACLALTVVALGLFVALARAVSEPANAIINFDNDKARSLRDYQVMAPALTSFFSVFTELGSKQFMFGLMGVVGLVLAWRKQPMFAAMLFIALVGGCGANEILKSIVQRPRPLMQPISSFSFPSGHTTGAMICYGLLAYLVLVQLESRWLARSAAAALVTLALLIGYSRVYLTVHYVSDVLGSFLLSVAWLALAIPALEVIRRRSPLREREERPSWEMAGDRRGFHGSRPLY